MYEYIQGTIMEINPYYLTLENSGIGYQILAANPFSFSAQVGSSQKIFIHQVIREDAHQLFGFHTMDEKLLFLKLISVSGIGPKSALAIMASEDMTGLVKAIAAKDVTYLTRFPGVGKKTASQMILDLEGKLGGFDARTLPAQNAAKQGSHELEEALEALLALGYAQRDVERVGKLLQKESASNTQEYISLAFKLMKK